MKKILLLSGLAILVLASCKKDYTCSCSSTTVNLSLGNEVFNDTKENAEALCEAREITLQSASETANISCELK